MDGAELSLRAVVAAPDGSADLRRSLTGSPEDPDGLGRRLARLLLEDGAAELMPGPNTPTPHDLPDPAGPTGTTAMPEPHVTERAL